MIITNRDPGLPELRFLATSGGLFLDFTIHDFDMARWLLGEDPVEVFAWGAVLVDPRVRTEGKDIDTAMLLLRTKSGKMCHINNTRRAVYGYDQRIEVFGSKGMLRAENLTPTSVERSGEQATCGDNPVAEFPDAIQRGVRRRDGVLHPQRGEEEARRDPARGQPQGAAALRSGAQVQPDRKTRQNQELARHAGPWEPWTRPSARTPPSTRWSTSGSPWRWSSSWCSSGMRST